MSEGAIDRLAGAISAMVSRVKVLGAIVSGRTLLQVEALDNEVFNQVELLLPPGWVARPTALSDALLLTPLGYSSHKVVLGGDNTADAVADLQAGEAGASIGGQRIILRIGRTEMIGPLLQWGPSEATLKRLVTEAMVALFNAHVHPVPGGGNTGVPTVAMGVTQLTGGS